MQPTKYPMPSEMTLPSSTVKLFRQVAHGERHPGLLLDKFTPPPDEQKYQREPIKEVCAARGDTALFASLREQRTRILQEVRAKCFEAKTAGSLTLHLARAAALENTGIHLHPVYGFVCLPGSGLKGMARAYAETIWLPGQPDKRQAWKNILDVFGWAPGTDSGKAWKPDNAETPADSNAGAVVFHEAWPMNWPCLERDIVNSHHKEYYSGNGAPGDWDSPSPVSFLSVAMGESFDFAVSLRGTADSNLLDLACEWLQGALVHEGAGAKTHAGYGRFRLNGTAQPASPPEQARKTSQHRLELVTPAFLAGAEQDQNDCDLRPATLRGLLRWWWRTMHVAHLKTDDLRRLESAIWGSAEQGAALSLSVRRKGNGANVAQYNKERILQNHLRPTGGRTTQGLFYVSFGMDERSNPPSRHYATPGAAWSITLSARKSTPGDLPTIEASEILRQGQAALWLLCRYGGVGSKARKGFGSFADIEIDEIDNIEDCKKISEKLRQQLDMVSSADSNDYPSLDHMLKVLEIRTPWRNQWYALGQLGSAMQGFAQKYKHKDQKAALGLPRKIHGPALRPLRHQNSDSHQPPKPLSNAKGEKRHASPVHYHLIRAENDTLTIRMVAFPSSVLPGSDIMLQELMEYVEREIKASSDSNRGTGQQPIEQTQSVQTTAPTGSSYPNAGDTVHVTLLEEKTRRGGWKARHDESGLVGPIQNSQEVPAECSSGQRVELIVASCSPGGPTGSQIAFRWSTH